MNLSLQQLPAICVNRWASGLLSIGYRTGEFPMRLRLLQWLRRVTGEKRIVATLCPGVRMALDDRDVIQRQLLCTGVYEPEVTELFVSEVKAGDQFLDVGSNVGYYSMLLQAQSAEVIAFEPDPLSAEVWRLNCRLNGAEARMQLNQYGLGDNDTTLTFHRTSVGNTGRSGFLTYDGIESLEVPVRKLDSVFEQLGVRANAVWKVDVEGFEGEMLRGAQRCLKERPPRLILFESDDRTLQPLPFELLESAGYRIEHLPRHSGERDEKENYVARRR